MSQTSLAVLSVAVAFVLTALLPRVVGARWGDGIAAGLGIFAALQVLEAVATGTDGWMLFMAVCLIGSLVAQIVYRLGGGKR